MEYILFIVRRFNTAKKSLAGFSFFSFIVVTGIAVGVAALIISLTVLNGFEYVLRDRLINLDSHIVLVPSNGLKLPATNIVLPYVDKVIKNDLVNRISYIEKVALITYKKKREGIRLKGIPDNYFQRKPAIKKLEGDLVPKVNSVVIGKYLAQKLFVKLGDKISVFALRKNAIPTADTPPVFEQFVVSGIFESGIARFDDEVIYIQYQQAASLFGFGANDAFGVELQLNSADKIDSLTDFLNVRLPRPYTAVNIFRLYKTVFTWIELQKKPIPLILGLITLVAVFNVISVTLMLVLEKSGAIGILRTLGTKRRVIGNIFLLQGIYLGLIGIFIGNILAYMLCYLQMKYNIVMLPANVYFTSKVPMLPTPAIFAEVSVLALVLSLVVSLVPAYIASKFSPVTTLRFQ